MKPEVRVKRDRTKLVFLGGFCAILAAAFAGLVGFTAANGLNYLDGRFITILFLVTPPALGLIAFSLLRAAVDRRDVLIIGETGLTLRPNGPFFNVEGPIHVQWTELDQVTAYDHAYGSGSLTFVKFSGAKHTINAGQLGAPMQTLLDLITERLAACGIATTRRQRYLFFANRTDLVRDGDT